MSDLQPADQGITVAGEIDQTKLKSGAAVIRGGQALVPIADNAQDLWHEYWDVIGAEGLNESELATLGITADTLAATVTLLENFMKFINGEETVPTAYRITLNKIRRAPAQI